MQVEHQEQQKHPQQKEWKWEHPQELHVEEWVQKMVESCKRQVLIRLSSIDHENLEISYQLDQIADASAFVAILRLS